MSYLTQELVGFNLNYHPQDFHVPDQETRPISPTSSFLNLAVNNSSSLKRRLPVPLAATVTPSKGADSDHDDNYQEPVAKRISLRNNEDHVREELQRMQRREREDIHYTLSGFSKISLPDVSTTSTTVYPPPKSSLRRTVSDSQIIARGYFYNQEESRGYNPGECNFPCAVSQENFTFRTSNGAAPSQTKAEGVSCGLVHSSSSLPPLPPPLRRTLSEPTPSPNELFPKCTVDGTGSDAEQSPNTKRLQKMKLRLREMGEWWAQVLREADGVEEEEDRPDGPNQQYNNKHDAMAKVQGGMTEEDVDETTETEIEEETTQEVVSVEMLGECLSINFSCPCNKGYQILLAGKNCYYKLV